MTDEGFELRDHDVILFGEGERGIAELRDAVVGGGRLRFVSSWQDALEALAAREVAALVVRADSGERALELLLQADGVAPQLERLVVAPSEEGLPLVEAQNRGALEHWIPSPMAEGSLRAALKAALLRHSTAAASRDLVELLRRRHETSERVIDALQDEAHELRRRLSRVAPTDRVTGLYNRRHLVDHWRRECARARRYGLELSLVLLAPRAGRQLAQEELRRVGTFLVLAIRDVDLAGRAGDDRFAVILPHCGKANAEALARRVATRFTQHAEADETLWDSGPWSPSEPDPEGISTVRLEAVAATLGPDGDDPGEVLVVAERGLDRALDS